MFFVYFSKNYFVNRLYCYGDVKFQITLMWKIRAK